jgi:hypothetical protein
MRPLRQGDQNSPGIGREIFALALSLCCRPRRSGGGRTRLDHGFTYEEEQTIGGGGETVMMISSIGLELITNERLRQIIVEGFTADHDTTHIDKELAAAAACYVAHYVGAGKNAWPWDLCWWKPSEDPIRNLVKAGALIAAEIDRLKGVQS